ncbi:MAG: hypothetical protein KIG95_04025, partial [Comamonas sp.]|nr:hypothetical protein [Comamonas sp.]
LYDWSAHIEFMAIMADDDVVSPTYYLDGYQALLNQPSASCISVGTSFADFGNGGLHNITQPSMRGGRTIERMLAWSGIAARITMYDVSRRAAITQGLAYLRATPLQGLTLAEDLIELSRLAHGDFIQLSGRGFFVHYPHHGAHDGGGTERFYELLCKPVGLNYNMVYFMALSTAIQCAIFLLGKYSPIKNINERMECAQYIFKKIYIESFLPKVAADGASEAASMLFSDHPNALAGFKKYCNLKNLDELVFDIDLLNWFLEILSVFEDRNKALENRISEKFKNFCIDVLN